MNSLGRHFRQQTDTSQPTCDYENCIFFTSEAEYSDLPYPPDVTLGPVSEPQPQAQPAGSAGDLSQILALLNQQKVDSEKSSLEIREQVATLQQQVSSILLNPAPVQTNPAPILFSNPAPAISPNALPPVHPSPPIFSSTTAAPNLVTSAAASLTAALQAGLGHRDNYGYSGLTMDQLRSSNGITSDAANLLASATRDVHPLNPLAGMGQALGVQRDQVISSVDQLYQATTVNKQLRAYEFASTGMFPYRSQIKQDNCNAITFGYGAIKHLIAAKSGLIKNMSDSEFLARLKHLQNVFEIACMSSPLSSFSDVSWQVAREYDARVVTDIESGVKSWDNLANGLEPDSIYMAKETVELRNKVVNKKVPKDPKGAKKSDEDLKLKKADPRKNGCTTYNTHRSSDGCYWEHVNKGDSCIYEHFCSWCKLNRDVKDKHKVLSCEYKPE